MTAEPVRLGYVGCGFMAQNVHLPNFASFECCRLVESQRITMLFAVPPVLVALLHHPDIGRVDWRSVRHVMIGAAPVPPEIARRFRDVTGVKVVQGYGLTEARPVVAVNHPFDMKTGSLGKVVEGQDVKIAADKELRYSCDVSAPERSLPAAAIAARPGASDCNAWPLCAPNCATV